MFNDLYYKVNLFLYQNEFDCLNIEKKKEIIDEGLKKYIISKLEINNRYNFSDNELNNFNTIDLFTMLSDLIPKDKHFDTIRFFSSYLLFQIMSIQNRNIILNKNFDNDYSCDFKDGCLNSITYDSEDYQNSFIYIYDIFMNKFMCSSKIIKKKF